MVVKARRNLARNEGPPKSVVERNKTKDNKKPTTFYVILFLLVLVVVSEFIFEVEIMYKLLPIYTFLIRNTLKNKFYNNFHILNKKPSPLFFTTNTHNTNNSSKTNNNKNNPEQKIEKNDAETMNKRLWDLLVPERNWSLRSPQFWVLLSLTIALYVYNRCNEKGSKETQNLLDQDKIKHNQIVHNNLIKPYYALFISMYIRTTNFLYLSTNLQLKLGKTQSIVIIKKYHMYYIKLLLRILATSFTNNVTGKSSVISLSLLSPSSQWFLLLLFSDLRGVIPDLTGSSK
uniref:Uncharacterized protein n=1 Tax=Theileria annulata TaxID=5874 RepID=A0A3B0MVJ2_THEAN